MHVHKPAPETASIAAGAASAIGASTCCVLPLVLVSMGLGGAWVARLRALEQFQWVFIGLAAALAVPALAGEPARGVGYPATPRKP